MPPSRSNESLTTIALACPLLPARHSWCKRAGDCRSLAFPRLFVTITLRMKKVALVFVLAVLFPSLVLAWLALRSLRDQQFLLERQQSLLCQNVTDALAQNIADLLAQRQQEFSEQVERLATNGQLTTIGAGFDAKIRQAWPLAAVGTCVTRSGEILSPAANAPGEAGNFYRENSDFLGNRQVAEVYGNVNAAANSPPDATVNNSSETQSTLNYWNGGRGGFNGLVVNQKLSQQYKSLADNQAVAPSQNAVADSAANKANLAGGPATSPAAAANNDLPQQNLTKLKAQSRLVAPQNLPPQLQKDDSAGEDYNLSRVIPAEGEFAQLIGDGTDGMLARFLQNRLAVIFWHRLNHDPNLIFGAQLRLDLLIKDLQPLFQDVQPLRDQAYFVLLDDHARPVAWSDGAFRANPAVSLKHPFVATEVGDALPHWEVAGYLINPAQLTQAAHTARLSLGLLIAVLVLVIGIGSWLIVSNLNSELKLARQKTDFVSNVSHELKTPLTSIRMFSELLSEGRVTDAGKQRSYLNIIAAEAARLTRLINNVLDFSRMERGEKKYNFAPCNLTAVVLGAAGTFRPHLEANGFKFNCTLPETPIPIQGDPDALSQIIVNLLSNAEKYSNGGREITLQLARKSAPLPYAEVRILDRGSGVPRGSGEKIFEKFYRAHDSLSCGIQGSGLGLTIARQIARSHGGDVTYEPRDGGGSCFILRLPLKPD